MRTSDFDPISIEVFNKQLGRATLLVLVVFGILVLRLWFLQILNGSTYRTKSENNRIRLQDIPPLRGTILDRSGRLLVGNRPSHDLYVIPEDIQDRTELFERLNRLIDVEPELAEKKLSAGSREFPFNPVCIRRDISRDELAVIETHRFNLPGVMTLVKPQRHYIFGHLASHLLGYLGEISEKQLRSGRYPGSKAGDLIGKSGVEGKWQGILKGEPGGEQVEVDAAGRRIRVILRKPPLSGSNIYLTIDKDLQAAAEKALEPHKGAIVALNPNSGEVLALASSPSFDPNFFVKGMDRTTWEEIISSEDFPLQNRALSGQYPPGSVFKIVLAVAGLEEGIIDPEEEEVCHGVFSLGRATYRCWKKGGHGKVNLHRALVESCDVYFYKKGQQLGVDRIARWSRLLGLGAPTGFDKRQEKGGLIPTRDWKLKRFGIPWQAGETISMSIGQSFVLVTPIQAAVMISAIFNGGILYRPQVIRRVEDAEGKTNFEFKPETRARVGAAPEHLEIIKRALIGAVNEPRGTGSRARLEDITVAGKTGTAQVVGLENEPTSDNRDALPVQYRDHAWFVAIAPAERPEIAVAVLIEHGGHGGSAAAPVAKEVMAAYLHEVGLEGGG
jgi:penicillin-binding protein 2